MKKLALFAMLLCSSVMYGCTGEKKADKPVDKPAGGAGDTSKPGADTGTADVGGGGTEKPGETK
jgi:hypothetical protein